MRNQDLVQPRKDQLERANDVAEQNFKVKEVQFTLGILGAQNSLHTWSHSDTPHAGAIKLDRPDYLARNGTWDRV
jgi:hypothetical protein